MVLSGKMSTMGSPPPQPTDDDAPRRQAERDASSRPAEAGTPPRPDARTGAIALVAAFALALLMVGLGEWVTRQTAANADRSAVIHGRVLLGPLAPVALPGQRQWKPVVATVVVTRREDGEEIAAGRSDRRGRYRIAVPAGEYLVTVRLDDPSLAMGVPTVEVVVGDDERVRVVLPLDTGLRTPEPSPSPSLGG